MARQKSPEAPVTQGRKRKASGMSAPVIDRMKSSNEPPAMSESELNEMKGIDPADAAEQEIPGQPPGADDTTEHENAESKGFEKKEEVDEQKIDDLWNQMGAMLATRRDRWIAARTATGWDRRVKEDIDQYNGIDAATRQSVDMMDVVRAGGPKDPALAAARASRSTVFVNITRQKSNTGEARLANVVLPTDENNWGLSTTPDVDAMAALGDNAFLMDEQGQPVPSPVDGQPIRKTEIARASMAAAKEACKKMERLIADQLAECEYNIEMRKVIHDMAVMGTGVMVGPVVGERTRRAWVRDDQTGVYALKVKTVMAPISYRMDPRLVWEDPAAGEDPKNGEGVYLLRTATARQVRDLAKQSTYKRKGLIKVLEEGPTRSSVLVDMPLLNTVGPKDQVFLHWHYYGEMTLQELRSCGARIPDSMAEAVSEEDPEGVLSVFSGCIEMINDTIVRAYLNPLKEHPVPVDFVPWESETDSPRGRGIPRISRSQQAVINAAWRQMMDNAGVASGPQFVIKDGAGGIAPMDGQWTVGPRKIWLADETVADVTKVFTVIKVDSHQADLAAIIELAEKLNDQESAVMLMEGGEKGTAPETLGGMQMLQQNNNVGLRRRVKTIDDRLTVPQLTRYYDFNMLRPGNDDCKGDFNVQARGISALVVKDIQNQGYLQLLAAATNPQFQPYVKPRELFARAVQSYHIDPEEILRTQAEVDEAARNTPPPEPENITVAKITAEARTKQAEAVAQGRAMEVEARVESSTEDRRLRIMELQLRRELAMLQLAQTKELTIEQIKAGLANSTIDAQVERELAASEMLFKTHASPDKQGI